MKSSPKKDANTTLQEMKDAITAFREERGWGKYHTPCNLAASISIEAAELLEHFQWGTEDQQVNKQKIAHELADIINYCLEFATCSDIDVSTAFYGKLELIKKKYPVEIFNPESEGLEEYHKIKETYREGEK
jgi:dCTP diphosphatase